MASNFMDEKQGYKKVGNGWHYVFDTVLSALQLNLMFKMTQLSSYTREGNSGF